MPKVQYTGTADSRSIDNASFRQVGVEDQNKVTWDKSNNFIAEVSESAAAFLLKTAGFKAVEEESPTGDDTQNATTNPAKG